MGIVISAQTLVLEGSLPGSSMECRVPICGALGRLPGPYIAFSDATSSSQCLWPSGGIFQKSTQEGIDPGVQIEQKVEVSQWTTR